jgi:hypothetical protein
LPCGCSVVNCWPSYDAASSTSTINLEYELESPSLSLHSLTITLPFPTSAASNLSVSEPPTCGDYSINAQGEFEWRIEEISAELGNENGSLEFEVSGVGEEGEDGEVFFPVGVEFVAQRGVGGVDVNSFHSCLHFTVYSTDSSCLHNYRSRVCLIRLMDNQLSTRWIHY